MTGEKVRGEKNSKFTRPVVLISLGALCCFLWGSAFPAIKLGYSEFEIGSGDTATQILFAGIRFTLAGLLVVAFGSIKNKRPLVPRGKSEWGKTLTLSLFQTVGQYVFFYIGLAHTSGVKASILISLNVFFAVIISAVFFKAERLSALKILGLVFGFLGVIVVNVSAGESVGAFQINGEGAIVLSAVAYAVSSVLIKKFSEKADPVMLSGNQFFVGGLIMVLCGVLAGGRLTAVTVSGVLILVYLALVSAVAYTLWGVLLKFNPVSRVAVMGFLNPVFGVLLSAVALGETAEAFSLKNVLALLLVALGIFAVNFKSQKSKGESKTLK